MFQILEYTYTSALQRDFEFRTTNLATKALGEKFTVTSWQALITSVDVSVELILIIKV